MYRNTNKINSLDYLKKYNNIQVYTEPTVIDNNVLLVPWISTEMEGDVYKILENSKEDYCLGHFDIIGFNMGSFENKTHGLQKKVFRKFKKVLSGHYHNKQKHGFIEYLGSQYEMTWGDHDGSKRGFHIFDSSNGDLKFIENKISMFEIVYIKNDTKLSKTKNFNNKIVKVILDGVDLGKSDTIIDQITSMGALQIIPVYSNDLFLENTDLTKDNISETQIEDTVSLISSIITDSDDISKDNKNNLTELFSELYKESINNEVYL